MTEQEALQRWPTLPDHIREQNEAKWDEECLTAAEIGRRRKLVIIAYDRTQEINPETGLASLGGAQPGAGRPRKKRLGRRITEHAQEEDNAQKIIDALFSGLEVADERIRVATAEKISRITHKEEELALREDEFDAKPKEELELILAGLLAGLSARGDLPDLKELLKPRADVEGTAVEMPNGDGTEAAA